MELNVFEINLYFLVIAKSEDEAIKYFLSKTSENIINVRECNIEKEGFVTFNEKKYYMHSFYALLEEKWNRGEIDNTPFFLRIRPAHIKA